MIKYKRILLKLSGEALAGGKDYGIDIDTVCEIANEIKEVHNLGVEVAIVVGGGNIFRGSQYEKYMLSRASADYIGMLATVINALTLQNILENKGVFTRVMTAIEMKELAEPYIRRRAIRHLEKGRVVIFGAGTGNPFFTTDTAAALRAVEIGADVMLKATKVDGIYSADPLKNEDAFLYKKISYLDLIKMGLKIMDITAITLCMENKLPIIVFNLKRGNIKKIVIGEEVGSIVKEE